MRFYLMLVFLCANSILSAATYYVAPNGSDSNPGTLTQPFFTLNKAWTVVAAGDIIYMRGGSYHYGTTTNILQDKSGTSSNPIKVMAYPGEYPVIDYAGVNLTGQKIGLRLHNINYVYIKGLRICNMAQENTGDAWPNYGVILYDDVNNCTFEQIEVDHIGGTGFTIADRCNNNLFLNCDSHHHADPYSSNPYGMSDGFESGSHGTNTSTNNTFRNCRAWSNSDDGWDFLQADGVYVVDNCWSFRNGFIPGTSTAGGNGDGYKLGGKTSPATNTILRTIKNSLAFENRATGITPEPDAAGDIYGVDIINCTTYRNSRDLGEGINTGNYNNYTRVRNTIAYGSYRTDAWMEPGSVHDHNSWDLPVTVTDADFISVSSSGVDGPRQSDGSMPATNFLHLAAGSDLIDKGTNVGFSYTGSAPDLGAFEFQSVTPPTATVYTSSSVENSTPSLLVMTYNLSLANITPAASSFSVMVNSVSRTVNSVAVSGVKVQLTLASQIVFGDVVTISYTKPSINPLQSTDGGQAISIGAQPVANRINAPVPVYVSSSIENATPTILEMTYNLSLANITPAASSFSVMVNSVSRTVSSVAVSGVKVQLALTSQVIYGDVVTISYTKPSANPLQTTASGQALSTGVQPVANRVNAPVPVYISSAIENATPSLLEMTYNLSLANIIPASTSFSVQVNSVARTINSVVISEFKVLLTLSTRVKAGDVILVSYNKPGTNPLQTTSGGAASGISNQVVVNKCINIVPVAAITAPAGAATFKTSSDILITASASDADGSVTLVEFFSGSVKLGSVTSSPYAFIWNNVAPGNYSLTVVATDNLNAHSVSLPVLISVMDPDPEPVPIPDPVPTPVSVIIPNNHPLIKISSPQKGNIYDNLSTVTIDAIASDADGTISKVEFYNGQIKIAEFTSAPFTYTWNDVPVGVYTITAIATDNMNDTTSSIPVGFEIKDKVASTVNNDENPQIVNLYPNPNDGHFSIEFSNPIQEKGDEITITDITGRKVYSGIVSNEENHRIFDFPERKSGMYVMMIKDKQKILTKKFIVK